MNDYDKTNSTFILLDVVFDFISFTRNFCDDDDDFNDSTTPGFPEFTSEISTAPGLKFTIEGKVADETGIANVSLYYPEWHLDKVIEFKEAPKEYFLQYSFLTPEDEEPESIHNIKVSVTDLGGNIATHDVVVTLDYDSTKPTIIFNTPAQGEPFTSGASVPLNLDFGDRCGLRFDQDRKRWFGLTCQN